MFPPQWRECETRWVTKGYAGIPGLATAERREHGRRDKEMDREHREGGVAYLTLL